ncbi:conserved hypothetical protein, partial [Listeria innocua FSL J1-023]
MIPYFELETKFCLKDTPFTVAILLHPFDFIFSESLRYAFIVNIKRD